ncbi:MAG: histidine phosphatase family protein [Atopobiaceae bacterium]|nr:histidine phosphatase family protein [Atopobiaceae bacterium]MCI2173196.1 histidine phosphatase family protein [Atopobiaceae bacterium]MCI2207191.1 histidine phosphatase family protein [Atopobiaceae bacterium]
MANGTRGEVLLLRHPETVANVDMYLSGQSDVALSKAGEAQKVRAIKALEAWRPDVVLTSPLTRCVGIAEKVSADLGIECHVDDRLIEIGFGVIEGLSHGDMVAEGYSFPWPIDEHGSHPCPDGESFEHLRDRAKDLVTDLSAMDGRTVCVTHGGFTRAFLSAVYDSDPHEFWHLSVGNVSSQLFASNGGKLYLEAFGLTPEEVIRRSMGSSPCDTVNAMGEY